jgi:hypothetical protein
MHTRDTYRLDPSHSGTLLVIERVQSKIMPSIDLFLVI